MDSGNETLFSEDSSPDSGAPPPSPSSGRGSTQPTPAPTPPHITSSLSKVSTPSTSSRHAAPLILDRAAVTIDVAISGG